MSGVPQVEIIPVTPFQQNGSLVWDTTTKRGALVDAVGEVERLLQRVEDHGVTLEKLRVTHAHVDHASGVATPAEMLDLPIQGRRTLRFLRFGGTQAVFARHAYSALL